MDRSELNKLYKAYGFIIYGRCIQLLRDKEEARDAMQVVFMKLIDSYDSIRDKEKVVPWIFRAARNHCYNLLRNRKKYSDEITPEEVADLKADQEHLMKKDLVVRIMRQYGDKVRDAVYYTYVEELGQREIYKITGQSPATIRRNLKHFREGLPNVLKRLGVYGL